MARTYINLACAFVCARCLMMPRFTRRTEWGFNMADAVCTTDGCSGGPWIGSTRTWDTITVGDVTSLIHVTGDSDGTIADLLRAVNATEDRAERERTLRMLATVWNTRVPTRWMERDKVTNRVIVDVGGYDRLGTLTGREEGAVWVRLDHDDTTVRRQLPVTRLTPIENERNVWRVQATIERAEFDRLIEEPTYGEAGDRACEIVGVQAWRSAWEGNHAVLITEAGVRINLTPVGLIKELSHVDAGPVDKIDEYLAESWDIGEIDSASADDYRVYLEHVTDARGAYDAGCERDGDPDEDRTP
jgi:hypothetical protein